MNTLELKWKLQDRVSKHRGDALVWLALLLLSCLVIYHSRQGILSLRLYQHIAVLLWCLGCITSCTLNVWKWRISRHRLANLEESTLPFQS